MPLNCGLTTPTAVEASPGGGQAYPDAGQDLARQERGPSGRVGQVPHQQYPDRHEREPCPE
jgi:hypothetical protein